MGSHTHTLTALLILCALAGCRPQYGSYAYTHTSETVYTSRAPECPFRVAVTLPDTSYEEIGVLDWDYDAPAYGYYISKLETFKHKVAKDVCKASGDLVVAEMNGDGLYIRGIVFKKRPEP